jgi:NTP pyrophosphatase (non-canonical NTP hydrolase)
VKFYEAFVQSSVFKTEFEKGLTIFGLGLNGESGEVAELVKKYLDRGKEIVPSNMLLELGDVLWYLTALGNLYGFTLEEIARANIAKLTARRAHGTHGFKADDLSVPVAR